MNIDFEQFKRQFKNLPLGLRINNVGCVKYFSYNFWRGQIGNYRGFARFSSFEFGIRAMTIVLMRYIYKYRIFDVKTIIETYAPAIDGNRTIDYVNYVIKNSGFGIVPIEIDKLKVVLPCVIYQMTCVENGPEYRRLAFDTDGYIVTFTVLVRKYIDEYLNEVVYPVHGKKETI